MKKLAMSLALGLAVFATGGAGLVYQVVFERYLSRIVGSDQLSIGLTLATFLGGLAAGYGLCGRLTRRVSNHLLVYALLEFAIGAWGLSFPWLFAGVFRAVGDWSFSAPWGLVLQGSLVAAVLIVPPTLAMGATVPFLTRGIARLREEVSSVHAAVYAVNTAGACAGALLAGFYLVPAWGLPGAVRGIAAVNLAAAAFFAALAWLRRGHGAGVELAGVVARPPRAASGLSRAALYGIGLLNGCAVLTLETSIVRIGKLVLGSSTYTFATVVAVFVLALALGSLTVARGAAPAPRRLFVLQIVAGLLLLLLYLTLEDWPYAAHLLRIAFQGSPSGFVLYQIVIVVTLFLLLAAPVALLGATLPVIFHELDAELPESGHVSGRLLAWNGVGTLLGSLGGGFLLYYLLDIARIFLLVPLLTFLVALLAAAPLAPRARALAAALLVVAAVFVAAAPFYEPTRLSFGTFRLRGPLPFSYAGPRIFYEEFKLKQRVLAQEDGPVASVVVLGESPQGAQASASLSLVVNGKSESNTRFDAETLRLAAHIPALWSPRRERTLVVGLGTGVTAGELSLYRDVAQIDVAEISPTVVRFLPRFGAFTHAVHEDPRLRLHVSDALLTLRRGRQPWDVIVSEASNPWVGGVDQLYTVEFFELVRSRLADGGLFLQWTQLYESDFGSICTVLNTLRAVFTTLHAFRGDQGDLLLLAALRPFTTADRQRAEAALAREPRVAASLAGIGITTIGQILEREVRTLPAMLTQCGPYPTNTMDRPHLHYRAGKAMFAGTGVTDAMLSGTTNIDFLFDERFRGRNDAGELGP